MFILIKLLLSYHLILISLSMCDSKNIDHSASSDSDPRIFFIYKDMGPLLILSKLSELDDGIGIGILEHMNIATLEYYAEGRTLFWTTTSGKLYSANLIKDEELTLKLDNATLLYKDRLWNPRSIALDEVGKKLYIVDTSERSIDVFDLDGKNKAKIFTSEFVIPCEIVLDPSEGLMFLYAINYLKRRTELHRMNMDGSDHRLLLDSIENLDYPTLMVKDSLAIDRVSKQLYFRSSPNDVSTVDYNGHGRNLILNFDRIAHFEVHSSRLYWSKSIEGEDIFPDFFNLMMSVVFGRERFLLRSCDLSKQTRVNSSFVCENILENELSVSYFNKFKMVDFVPRKQLANPCFETDNGCEDHCLLKPSELGKQLTFGCACRLGRNLNNDGKTCSDLQEQNVDEDSSQYAYENFWYLYNSGFENSSDVGETNDTVIYELNADLLKKLLSQGSQVVFDNALNYAYLVNNEEQLIAIEDDVHTIRNLSELQIANVLAYDYVSRNLYYATTINESDQKYNLFVISTRYPEKEILLGQIDSPTSMVVHPYRGYLFIATFDKDKNESHIIRFNTDGKERRLFPYSNNTKILLSVDMGEDKLYWTDRCSNGNQCIRSASLDGDDSKLLINSNFTEEEEAETIISYQEEIYIKSGYYLHIFNKTDDGYKKFILAYLELAKDPLPIKGKVKKTDVQYLSEKNPCLRDNGGCEFFCFAVPMNESVNLQKVCSG